jgi:hypothetical protein
MQSLSQLVGKFWRQHGVDHLEQASSPRFEPVPRFGEILAALSIPDFAGLPLEYWPGYRHVLRDREREAPSAHLQSGADKQSRAAFGRCT